MTTKRIYPILVFSLLTAWIFDQLFWQKSLGISVFIFVVIYLSGLSFITIIQEHQRPHWSSFIPVAPILFCSGMIFLRTEPFTTFLNLLLVLVFLFILTDTWLGGKWLSYGMSDYVVRSALLVGLGLAAPFQAYLSSERQPQNADSDGNPENGKGSSSTRKWLGSIVMGLFLAAPVVFILALLLSNADPIFQKQWNSLFNWDSIQVYFVRGIIILFIAYLTMGGVLFSLIHTKKEKLIGLDKPLIPPFLNWITAIIILGSINLLFIAFVLVQFQYFFGGQTNISIEGFTYADYARRGFGELIVVAFLSLLVFLGLGFATQRSSTTSRNIFSGMGILLVLLVGVILVSAFNRLYLYEEAYGFSRIRAFVYVFMIWLGILLLSIATLEVTNRLRWFALATLIVVTGFSMTISMLNVDGLIVRENVANTRQGKTLDTAYLLRLSDDSIPDLFNQFHNPGLTADAHSRVGWALICYQKMEQARPAENSWPSFNWTRYQSQVLYNQYANELGQFPTTLDPTTGEWNVSLNGVNTPCY